MELKFDGWLVVDGELMGPTDARFPPKQDRENPNVRAPDNDDISLYMFNAALGESHEMTKDDSTISLSKHEPLWKNIQEVPPASTPRKHRPTNAASLKKEAETSDRVIADLETAKKKPGFFQVAKRSNLADTDQAMGALTARAGGRATKDQDMEAEVEGEDLILSEGDLDDMEREEVAQFSSDFLEGWDEETARRKKAEQKAAALNENKSADDNNINEGGTITTKTNRKRGREAANLSLSSSSPSTKRQQTNKNWRPDPSPSPSVESDSTLGKGKGKGKEKGKGTKNPATRNSRS
jgi:hypothetical protein